MWPKTIVLFLAMLYLSVYIPLVPTVYLPYWYEINCSWHPRCDRVGRAHASRSIEELTAFLGHRRDLKFPWTKKEQRHLLEVRAIFDRMFGVALAAAVAAALCFDRRRLSRAAFVSAVIVASLSLLLPVFKGFWMDVFHTLLFDNDWWRNNRFDQSYYIMPTRFFKYTAALLICVSVGINLGIWWLARPKELTGRVGVAAVDPAVQSGRHDAGGR
jgi:uncharacterized membrane protein